MTYKFENGDAYGVSTGALGSTYKQDIPYGANGDIDRASMWPPKYKYKEDRIISDFHAYIDKTYGQHYMTEEQNIECFDVWLALGDSMPTFRNTAIKYLWRYGKKHGSNKDDLLKVLHYVIMMLYADHYKDKK